jgi:O-antigen/teichoic acid export membrane protein
MLKKLKSKNGQILLDSLWTTFGRIGGVIFGVIVSVLIARYYGAQTLGSVAIINSILSIAIVFSVLGTGTSIMRLIPEHIVNYSYLSSYKVYQKILKMTTLFALIMCISFLIFSNLLTKWFFSEADNTILILIAGILIVFKTIMTVTTQAIRGLEDKYSYAILQLFPHGPNLLLLCISLLVFPNIHSLPIITLMAGIIISSIVSYRLTERNFKNKLASSITSQHLKLVSSKDLLKISLPMFFADSSFILISQTGIIILGLILDEKNVGYYSVAVSIATISNLFFKSINSVVAPKFSKLYFKKENEEIFNIAKSSSKISFWLTLPITIVMALFGTFVIKILYGQEYVIAFLPMMILAVGQLINAMSGATATAMNMTGNQMVFQNIMLFTVFINLILCYFFIKFWGINGAAASTSFSSILWNALVLIFMKKKFGKTTAYFPFKIK